MKFILVIVLLLVCCSVATKAQSCLTQDDVRQMLTRIDSSTPATPNKKLKEELLKMAMKQQELLQQVVHQDLAKKSDQEKLHKIYQDHTVKLCQILKTNGWPTTATRRRWHQPGLTGPTARLSGTGGGAGAFQPASGADEKL